MMSLGEACGESPLIITLLKSGFRSADSSASILKAVPSLSTVTFRTCRCFLPVTKGEDSRFQFLAGGAVGGALNLFRHPSDHIKFSEKQRDGFGVMPSRCVAASPFKSLSFGDYRNAAFCFDFKMYLDSSQFSPAG